MKLAGEPGLSKKFHEIQLTIDDTRSYAELVEVFREGKNGRGYIVITSIKTIEPAASVPDFVP